MSEISSTAIYSNSHHSSSKNVTFQQHYQLDTSRFKPGGPILFYQGAENSQINCVEYNHFDDIADELGAIVAGLEHRFFGDSFPTGVSEENATAKDLAPLTLDNVLLDSVAFVNWIKNSVPGASNAKVIINGGSYGGFLATIARTRHPDIFDVSWASAAILQAFGSQEDNPDRFKHWDYVAEVYQEQSAKVSSKIGLAMHEFKSCSTSEQGCPQLSAGFNLCDPQPANVTEWSELYSAIEMFYLYAAQFNSRRPLSWPVGLPLQRVVNQTLQANDTGSIVRIPAMLWNRQLNSSHCLGWKSVNITGGAVSGVALKSYEWITCNYLIYSTDSIRNGSLFPAQDVPPTCPTPGWEGANFNNTNQQWIDAYGISKENLAKLGRFLFTQGGYDPTTAVGPPKFDVPESIDSARTMLMRGLSHTEDTYSNLIEPVGLNPELDLIQHTITQVIAGWVNGL